MSKLSSWLSKRGGTVGKVANDVGAVAKKVLPSPGGIIGSAAGPVGGIIGSLVTGHSPIEDAEKGAALAGPLALATHDSPTPGAPGGDTPTTDPATGQPGPAGATPSTGGDMGVTDYIKKYGGDVIGALTQFAKDHGTTALEAWNIYNAAQRGAKSDQYAQDAIKGAQSAYDAKAPLRMQGIAGLQTPFTPDLSAINKLSTTGSGNPFAGALPMAPQGQPGRPISAGPINNTPTPSLPGGPMGGQTLQMAPQGPPPLAPVPPPVNPNAPKPTLPFDPNMLTRTN